MTYPALASYQDMVYEELCDRQKGIGIIGDWVAEGQEEHLYLDFTRKHMPLVPELHDHDSEGYAKALSGFANSDGGLLVWGVRAERRRKDPHSADIARELVPIADARAFCTKLNHLIQNATKPVVPGVRNTVVLDGSGSGSGYVVTYVPVGANPPYRARLGKADDFYKRHGDSFVSMEPYEIRDVVFRFRYPKVRVSVGSQKLVDDILDSRYAVCVTIANEGPTVLRDYKLEIALPSVIVKGAYPDTRWGAMSTFTAGGMQFTKWELHVARALRGLFDVYPGEEKIVVDPTLGLHCRRGEVVWAGAVRTANVMCRLFGADMPPLTVEMPCHEIWNPSS